jgi:hypothetical protein
LLAGSGGLDRRMRIQVLLRRFALYPLIPMPPYSS